MFTYRPAEESDCEAVAALMNAHNFSLDENASLSDNKSALAFINGYFESNPAMILSHESSANPIAVVNLQPDSQRKRFSIELFSDPNFEQADAIVEWAINQAHSINPAWQICPGANAKDQRFINAWSIFGFEIARRFSVMRVALPSSTIAESKAEVKIEAIDTSDDSQRRLWHALHQDAFANHYGFTPRPFDEWIQMVTRDPSFDPGGVLIAKVNGEPVGFCHHTDEFSAENRGFIIGLGVGQAFQGHGYGQALLAAGIAYAEARGYSGVELAVDTGNETGALNLYDKFGFQVTAAWVHLAKQA